MPADVRGPILAEAKKRYPTFERAAFDRLLTIFWLNNPNHTKNAPPHRLAQRLHSLHLCEQAGGLSLEIQPIEDHPNETSVSFAVASPPQKGFLAQMMEVFNRLDLGITGRLGGGGLHRRAALRGEHLLRAAAQRRNADRGAQTSTSSCAGSCSTRRSST